jgi:hypothetical protein
MRFMQLRLSPRQLILALSRSQPSPFTLVANFSKVHEDDAARSVLIRFADSAAGFPGLVGGCAKGVCLVRRLR